MIQNTQKHFKASEFISCCIYLAKEACHIINDVKKSSNLLTQMKGVNDPVTEADFQVQSLIFKGIQKFFPEIKLIGEEDQLPEVERQFDYSKINLNLIPNDLFGDSQDEYLQTQKAIVFIDPLDGTLDFVKNKLEAVSTLIGLAYDGKPIIGINSHGYIKLNEQQEYNFQPRIYFGYSKQPKLFYFEDNEIKYDVQNIIPKELQVIQDPESMNICVTESRLTEEMKKNIEGLNPSKINKIGGCGYKILNVLTGQSDLFIYEKAGCKRWDTCSGEALLKCMGGSLTGIDGIEYEYKEEQDKELLVNQNGIIATLDKNKHQKAVDHYLKIRQQQK